MSVYDNVSNYHIPEEFKYLHVISLPPGIESCFRIYNKYVDMDTSMTKILRNKFNN